MDYELLIQEADRVYQVAQRTPLQKALQLSKSYKQSIWFKREDLQPVFSFKLRGAFNKMATLTSEQRRRGVITASAGNHAQGVAFSGRQMGIPVLIVMPVTAPQIKVAAVQALGGQVILHGVSYSEAQEYALQRSRDEDLCFIPPFDDPLVIAGQGTVGREILMQHPEPITAIFVPVGGGGLLAGVAVYVKRHRPDILIIGVQPKDSCAMKQSLQMGERVNLPQVGLFADGVAVRQVGVETFRLCQDWVDDIITVDTDELCAAMKDFYDETRVVLEPAGALSVAGVAQWIESGRATPHALIAISSGANCNFDRLRFVAERAQLGEHREAIFAATIPESIGSFRAFCQLLGDHSVTEFNYRYSDPNQAHVFVGVSIQSASEVEVLFDALRQAKIAVLDLHQNELAKSHLRYLVGGHAPGIQHEWLYRFEFPERPGALMTFLNQLGRDWNITLFHYRNHGSDSGQVLVGLQVPPGDKQAFETFLQKLGYPWVDETNNPVRGLFLGKE